MPMQRSHYLKAYPCDQPPEHVILFSTKKASVVRVHEDILEEMENGTLSPDDEVLLSKLEMITPDRDAEKRAMLTCLDELNSENKQLSVTIVLNLDCNFACPYCYEGNMKGNLYMSRETADQVILFIKEKFASDKTSLFIDFYGGEPLLSIGLIRLISQEMKSFTQARNASFRFRIITNGSLLKRQIAEELVPLGFESVKVTLDGPPEIHDQSRPFKSGAGSFDIIIQNLRNTCDLIKITIGGNYTPDNHEKFPLVLDILEKAGLTPDKLYNIKFDPVMKPSDHAASSHEFQGGCASVNEPWIAEASEMLRKAILTRGYPTPKPRPIHCMVEHTSMHVIHFDGTLYKCPALIGQQEYAVGSLETGIKDHTVSHNLGRWKNPTCLECEYLPLCFGGCRYMSFIKNGNLDALDCQKAFFDTALENMIKQDVIYR